MKPARTLLAALLLALVPAMAACADDPAAERAQLVRRIEQHVQETAQELGKDRLDPRVLAAIGRVPRHDFVPPALRALAYLDRPLPIGEGQTISQPYVVAVMTDLLALPPGARVLEVGTGSGYQAAVLAETGAEVYTIEIVESLGREAAELLQRLGYEQVRVKIGDGFAGWPEHAPFDGIIVTAAAPKIPPPLIAQLRPGGRMIIPLGDQGSAQDLVLVEKNPDGGLEHRSILPVLFVPLTGEGGRSVR